MSDPALEDASAAKVIPPAAERALREAAERRARQPAPIAEPAESGGVKGPDPTRYGDWERKGVAVDF